MATRNQVDGYRLRVERDGDGMRLITRSGNNWTDFMGEAARKVCQKRSCIPRTVSAARPFIGEAPFEHLLRRLATIECVGSARRRHLVKGLASPAAQG